MPAGGGAQEPEESPGSGCTALLVLIVEDDLETRTLYEYMFSAAGFRCAAASTGDDGVAMAARLQPDVIVTDIGIPGTLDGCAMTRLLKSNTHTCRIPVVAVTGYDARQISKAADFQNVLTKPIQPDALVAALRMAMQGRIL
jgi:CheY-like chemotaxis protein